VAAEVGSGHLVRANSHELMLATAKPVQIEGGQSIPSSDEIHMSSPPLTPQTCPVM